MLIESTRLFGTQEYVPATIQLVLSSVRSYKRITHPQNNVIHSEKESMLSYLLVFKTYFLNLSNTGTVGTQSLNELDADS